MWNKKTENKKEIVTKMTVGPYVVLEQTPEPPSYEITYKQKEVEELPEAVGEPEKQVTKSPVKQFELSDSDTSFLGAAQYSDAAWQDIGRKHGIDPTTRISIENTQNRAFIAEIKKWEPLTPVGGMVTTKNIGSSEYRQTVPVPANSGAIRDEMRKRDLTKPTSDEVVEEQVDL